MLFSIYVAVLCITAFIGFLLVLIPKVRAHLWMLFPPSKQDTPFAKLTEQRKKDLVVDKAERDKVIKNGFSINKVPNNLDAIVIGSGMGGLTAAALLAKMGQRVLVLEQHDQAGGCCHVFVEKGFEFDVGIHYIGEMRDGTLSRILVDQLTEGGLQWEPLEEVYDTVAIGEHYERRYQIYSGKTKLMTELVNKFPGEEKAIKKYFDLLKEARRTQIVLGIVKCLPGWLLKLVTAVGLLKWAFPGIVYFSKSLSQVLDELTSNVELKAVLAYSFGDYGTAPSNASFMMHALLFNHMLNGPFYPKGGASEIAYHMIPVIQEAGGDVLVRVKVKEIMLDDGGTRTVGVKVVKGNKEHVIQAPTVISDAGIVNTYKKLLAPEVVQKFHMDHVFKQVKPGLPLLSVFIGLEGTKEELDLKATNVWAFTDPNLNNALQKYTSLSPEEARNAPIPLLFVSFPSAKDPTYNARYPGKSTCAIVTVAPFEWFKEWKNERVMHRGDEYQSLKNEIGQRMWHQILEMYPHLEGKVEYFDVGTPLSNQFYLGSYSGEVYGLDHDLRRFSLSTMAQLRPDTPITGLYLTGQDIFVCGFSGAMYGGLFCVSSILKRNLVADLMRFKSQLRKTK